MRIVMSIKAYAAGLSAAVIAIVTLAVSPVVAQTTPETTRAKKQTVYTTGRATPANRPRARVTVAPRSFLDAGTEVLPGERKFQEYAFPTGPYSMPLSVVTNTGGRVGWHNSPLPGPFDLPSRWNPYGW
jgi:hypothetical protein